MQLIQEKGNRKRQDIPKEFNVPPLTIIAPMTKLKLVTRLLMKILIPSIIIIIIMNLL